MAIHKLTARTLLNGIGSIEYPVVTMQDGRITRIDQDPATLAEASDVLAPAFLDIHTHGALGHDVMSASASELGEMQKFLAAHGVGHYLPTTVTAPLDSILHALENLANVIERKAAPCEARPVGIHLEGPFLSHAKRGVHPTEHLLAPTPELLQRLHTAARGHIALMTIAPELPGALETIAYAKTLGIRASLGHSDAKAADALAGIDAGATSATHTFNAMRALDHREPGLVGVTLNDNRLFAELICDGVHVDPSVVRLWWKTKGAARGILVTDAMSAAGMPDGNYSLGGLAVTVRDGRAVLTEDLARGKETLAGSLLTMDRAVANFRSFTGVHTLDAARLSSANPAIMLGRTDLVQIAPGSAANLVHLDAHGNLLATYIHGERIPAMPR